MAEFPESMQVFALKHRDCQILFTSRTFRKALSVQEKRIQPTRFINLASNNIKKRTFHVKCPLFLKCL